MNNKVINLDTGSSSRRTSKTKKAVSSRNTSRHVVDDQFVQAVAQVVQGLLQQGQVKNFVSQQPKVVLVKEPFYMKNGGPNIPMLTQGKARNVPGELAVVKQVGNKVITIERFRARLPQYIQIRSLVNHNGTTALGLREIENRSFSTPEEAGKVVSELMAFLSK